MNLDNLNKWLTLLANLGVLAGIIFLAMELQQNSKMMEAQTRDSITEKQMEMYGWVATNRDLATVWSAGLRGVLEDPIDQAMFTSYLQGIMREWENSHRQFQLGLFSQDEFEARLNRWRSLLAIDSARNVWTRSRSSFASDFRLLVDGLVEEWERDENN